MSNVQVKFLLAPGAKAPAYQTDGAAALDLHAHLHDSIMIDPADTAIFPTGLYVAIPLGYVGLLFSRSGHGFKNDVRLANCVGVIDADFRGEVKVKLTNDHLLEPFEVKPGDRIAQLLLVEVPKVRLVEVEDLGYTERGAGGFGSTGT